MDALLVITNLPDRDSAERLARRLVEERAAACVNVMAQCQSHYRWQGRLEQAAEVPLFIKTTAGAYGRLEELIRRHHPYELPEIVRFRIDGGDAAYLQWIRTETD